MTAVDNSFAVTVSHLAERLSAVVSCEYDVLGLTALKVQVWLNMNNLLQNDRPRHK